jgi:hypothetical protein
VDVSVTTTAVRHLVREYLIDADRKSVDEVPPTLKQHQTAAKSSPLSTDNQLNERLQTSAFGQLRKP